MEKDWSIKVRNLSKSFAFSVKSENKNFLQNLFSPDRKIVSAVKNLSLEVKKGERIAFIGPNGAGKSTTIKMLTGILFPTSGEINVLGLDPKENRKKLAYKIGTVFGQRSQVFPNLPLTESMRFFGVMYNMTNAKIEKRIRELCDTFDLNSFKDQPVRKLSLGQRMRVEIACALIHKPEIIFLDEPTIGLDVIAKKSMRELLLRLNKEEGTTIFLTSHDVGDIESLCERTIIVNHGEIVKDLPTSVLTKTFVHEKYIDLILDEDVEFVQDLPNGIKLKEKNQSKISLVVDLHNISVSEALQKLLSMFKVHDIDVYDVDLETVIREMYDDQK